MSDESALFERERSCLVVIDVQQYFLDKLPLHWRGPLVERIAWLMRATRLLDIPVVATAEDVERDGPLMPELERCLPAGAPPVFNKMVFGLWGQEDIRAAVEATGRDCFVLAGLETDVCVAQSALGLRRRGLPGGGGGRCLRVAASQPRARAPAPGGHRRHPDLGQDGVLRVGARSRDHAPGAGAAQRALSLRAHVLSAGPGGLGETQRPAIRCVGEHRGGREWPLNPETESRGVHE